MKIEDFDYPLFVSKSSKRTLDKKPNMSGYSKFSITYTQHAEENLIEREIIVKDITFWNYS